MKPKLPVITIKGPCIKDGRSYIAHRWSAQMRCKICRYQPSSTEREARSEAIVETEVAITDAIEQGGQYTHNIISCTLRALAVEVGYDAANQLVDELSLTESFGIPKMDITKYE